MAKPVGEASAVNARPCSGYDLGGNYSLIAKYFSSQEICLFEGKLEKF